MYRQLGTRIGGRRVSVALARVPLQRSALRDRLFPLQMPSETILSRLRAAGPDILIIGASTALWLAGAMNKDDRQIIRSRLVPTWGEMSTPEMRSDIGRAFHAQVIFLLAWAYAGELDGGGHAAFCIYPMPIITSRLSMHFVS